MLRTHYLLHKYFAPKCDLRDYQMSRQLEPLIVNYSNMLKLGSEIFSQPLLVKYFIENCATL